MENYLEDVINQLIEEALRLKNESKNEFDQGKLFGYYETISKLLNQAEAFNIVDKIPSKWQNFKPECLLESIT